MPGVPQDERDEGAPIRFAIGTKCQILAVRAKNIVALPGAVLL